MYAKIVKAESRGKVRNEVLRFGNAEAHPILCKDSESREQRQSEKRGSRIWQCRGASYLSYAKIVQIERNAKETEFKMHFRDAGAVVCRGVSSGASDASWVVE